LYVHYEDRAVQHLLSMTCGLESMVVGESQILGQVRQALALARKHQTLDHTLDDLGMLALRTAKRAHTQTGIDRAGANLVTVGACTGAAGLVITADMVTAALRERQPAGGARPLVLLDLALPHDVDPRAGHLPGVTVIGLETLQDAGASLAASQAGDVAAVRAI